jgi:hypothetical protein
MGTEPNRNAANSDAGCGRKIALRLGAIYRRCEISHFIRAELPAVVTWPVRDRWRAVDKLPVIEFFRCAVEQKPATAPARNPDALSSESSQGVAALTADLRRTSFSEAALS